MSAPVSWVVSALAASASAAAREVGLVDRDPLAAGADERPRFLGQLADLGRGELDVVEHRRPAHVGELVGADRGLLRLREHAQHRRGLARGQLGDAHVEAGVGEPRAGDGHQLPRLVLAEDGVAAPVGAGAQQRGEHALEAGDVVVEVGALGAVVDDGALDGDEHLAPPPDLPLPLPLPFVEERGLATNTSRSHTPVRSGGSRRTISGACSRVTERDHCSARDTSSPATRVGRVEGAAVEAGEERFGDVVAGAHDGRRRGHLDAARAVAADGVDHAGERGAGDGAGVDARIEGGDAAGHGVDDVGEPIGIDQRGRPAHRVRRVVAARRAAPASALAQHRHHRAPCRELDRPHRDLAQPADARADVVAHVAGTRGDQPAEHLADGRAHRGGLLAAGDAHVRVRGPRRGGRLGVGEELGHLVGGGGGTAGAAGPGDDPTRLPRELQAHDAGLDGLGLAGGSGPGPGSVPWPCSVLALVLARLRSVRAGPCRAARAALAGEAEQRLGEDAVDVLGVGDDLVALLAGEAAGRDEVLVGVDEETQQRGPPGRRVGVEDRRAARASRGRRPRARRRGRRSSRRRAGAGCSVVVVLLIVVTARRRFWRAPCSALEVRCQRRSKTIALAPSGCSAGLHSRARSPKCSPSPSALRRPFARRPPAVGRGGGRAGRRSRG